MDSRVLERRAAASDSRGRGADASALREKARQQRDAALQLAQEGVALREQVALTTGELPEAWPYVMLAYALQAAGQAPEAREVLQQGIEAARKNPESGPMPCVVCPK